MLRAQLIRASASRLLAIRASGVTELRGEGIGAMYDRAWPVLRLDTPPELANGEGLPAGLALFIDAVTSLGLTRDATPATPAVAPTYVTTLAHRALKACCSGRYRIVVHIEAHASLRVRTAMRIWAQTLIACGSTARLLRADGAGVRAHPLPTDRGRLLDWMERAGMLDIGVPGRIAAIAEPWRDATTSPRSHFDSVRARAAMVLDAVLLSQRQVAKGWRCGVDVVHAETRARAVDSQRRPKSANGVMTTLRCREVLAVGGPLPIARASTFLPLISGGRL